ncbi:dihydrofolate reductase [Agaribacterium sp. ZY112]|uniref:dihydrofolate reductase n=1 Tax=Agaribacterium sp. ZY112 TaxID=3233574 RepID=UPI00352474F9
MEKHIVVAMAKNNVIGVNNTLPWHLPADLKHFKELTIGQVMLMGRLTFDSIGRALPKRTTIVITRDRDWSAEGVLVCYSLDEAIELAQARARDLGLNKIMIAGGANIYRQLIDQADVLHVTEVDLDIDGDAYFPNIDKEKWRELDRQQKPAGSENQPAYAFISYEKKTL